MKISGEVITESDFLWHGLGKFAQNYLIYVQKMKKISNQFNKSCYLRASFDLKMQDLFETSNHREHLKCEGKFYKKSISRLQIIELIQQSFLCKWLVKWLVAFCFKFILQLLKKHVARTNSHNKARNTKIIKLIQ